MFNDKMYARIEAKLDAICEALHVDNAELEARLTRQAPPEPEVDEAVKNAPATPAADQIPARPPAPPTPAAPAPDPETNAPSTPVPPSPEEIASVTVETEQPRPEGSRETDETTIPESDEASGRKPYTGQESSTSEGYTGTRKPLTGESSAPRGTRK